MNVRVWMRMIVVRARVMVGMKMRVRDESEG